MRTYIGRYEAKRLLGEGGNGRVFLAREYAPDRHVVVKVMHEHLMNDPKFRERFLRETRTMARLNHPHAVKLLDASLDDAAGPCIVMEYIDGTGLDELLRANKRFAPARTGRIIGQLCDVLQSAHDLRIVHRDLKPSNLMIVHPDTPDEQVKVMDFGLAKIIDPDVPIEKITDTGSDFAVGTPSYISPEQVRGEEIDHRADLYSVGVIAYELLSGQLPFQRATNMDMILAHATDRPTTFGELGLNSWVPRAVEDVVMACLEKDPSARPASARELADCFESALAEPEHEPRVFVSKADDAPAAAPLDPDAMAFHLDAWLPKRIALIKIRGFVHDFGGDVTESGPGLIRVTLGVRPRRGSPAGGLALLGLGGKSKRPNDMELRLQHIDPHQENKLRITVLFRAPNHKTLHDVRWREQCNKLFCEVRAYLMGSTES